MYVYYHIRGDTQVFLQCGNPKLSARHDVHDEVKWHADQGADYHCSATSGFH